MKHAELVKLAPREIGGTARVNHPHCPAGEDRKKRLFIARTPRGVWAECHHCARRYFAPANLSGLEALDALEPSAEIANDELDEHIRAEVYYQWWHEQLNGKPNAAMRAWVKRKRFTPHCRKALRVYRDDLLYIPIYAATHAGEIVQAGYQTRYFGDEPVPAEAPKYISERWYAQKIAPGLAPFVPSEASPWSTRWAMQDFNVSGSLFVVEGFAEACYLAEHGHMAAALYGSGLTSERLLLALKTTSGITDFVLWLDNDKPEIIDQALRITQAANLIRPASMLQGAAPTDLEPDQLQKAIDAHRRNRDVKATAKPRRAR